MEKIAAILGVGPGLGAAVARRFAREGFAVGLLARNAKSLAPVQAELEASGARALPIPCDAGDAASVAAAFATLRHGLGHPGVLVYNAGAFVMGGILELDPARFEAAWRANCLGALLAAQQALPAMVADRSGTILLSGATGSLRGGARFAGLAVGKFGLRALAQSMAREFGPQGVHVAHFVIDGQIASERTRQAGRAPEGVLDPDAIADTYWQTHNQHPSAWSLELDLRPSVEKF
jgi:NAD(P)-dependent dehydrogenase (short-subunit alcohol dehydrogenase family)